MTVDTHADGIDREKDKERFLSRLNPELRAVVGGIDTQRVPSVGPKQYGTQTIDPIGWYEPPRPGQPSSIRIREDAQDFEAVLTEELLHGANFEYKVFRDDLEANFARLWQAVVADHGNTPHVQATFWRDPMHTFTNLAKLALMRPETIGLNVYRYFLPLRQVEGD